VIARIRRLLAGRIVEATTVVLFFGFALISVRWAIIVSAAVVAALVGFLWWMGGKKRRANIKRLPEEIAASEPIKDDRRIRSERARKGWATRVHRQFARDPIIQEFRKGNHA